MNANEGFADMARVITSRLRRHRWRCWPRSWRHYGLWGRTCRHCGISIECRDPRVAAAVDAVVSQDLSDASAMVMLRAADKVDPVRRRVKDLEASVVLLALIPGIAWLAGNHNAAMMTVTSVGFGALCLWRDGKAKKK